MRDNLEPKNRLTLPPKTLRPKEAPPMGKTIELTNKELEGLTDKELKILENHGVIEKIDKRYKVKKEIRTK